MSAAGELDRLSATVTAFLAARVQASALGRVSAYEMHKAYLIWSEQNDALPYSPARFRWAMERRGYVMIHARKNYWPGVAFRPALALVRS